VVDRELRADRDAAPVPQRAREQPAGRGHRRGGRHLAGLRDGVRADADERAVQASASPRDDASHHLAPVRRGGVDPVPVRLQRPRHPPAPRPAGFQHLRSRRRDLLADLHLRSARLSFAPRRPPVDQPHPRGRRVQHRRQQVASVLAGHRSPQPARRVQRVPGRVHRVDLRLRQPARAGGRDLPDAGAAGLPRDHRQLQPRPWRDVGDDPAPAQHDGVRDPALLGVATPVRDRHRQADLVHDEAREPHREMVAVRRRRRVRGVGDRVLRGDRDRRVHPGVGIRLHPEPPAHALRLLRRPERGAGHGRHRPPVDPDLGHSGHADRLPDRPPDVPRQGGARVHLDPELRRAGNGRRDRLHLGVQQPSAAAHGNPRDHRAGVRVPLRSGRDPERDRRPSADRPVDRGGRAEPGGGRSPPSAR